jgi:hypothetical protein
MKKNLYMLLFFGICIMNVPAVAQKTVVVVEPDEGINIGALNDAISSAADPGNTIFELRRGGHYLLNGAISHEGYTLHIRAEEGDGVRPLLQTAVDQLGESENHFNPAGDLILEGLYINAVDELGALERRQIIVSGDGIRITIDDCYFDYGAQSVLRLTSSNNKIYVRNSILRNIVTPEKGNGRIIDNRSNPQDTILIENSTLYNFYANAVRFGNALVANFIFNQNTVFQAHHWSGWVLNYTLHAKITNNIFYNFALAGNPYDHSPLFWSDSIFTIGEYTDADRTFDLSNNNWYNQQEFGDILDQYYPEDILYRFAPEDTDHSDTIWYKATLRTDLVANPGILDTTEVNIPALVKFIEAGQADTTNNFSEPLIFKNPPPLILDYWQFFAEFGFNIGSVGSGSVPSPFADEDPDELGEVTEGAFDFGFNTGSRSATAAEDGRPLGDPRWTLFAPVSAKTIANSKSIKVYPNPFSETVTFTVESEKSASVKISIFDILGKEIVNNQRQIAPGFNSVQMNLSKI